VLHGRSGFWGQPRALGRFGAALDAQGCFLVQTLRHGCGSTLVAHAFDYQFPLHGPLAQAQKVTHFELARGLDVLPIDLHPTQADRFAGE
jgi:hypothetical protein